MLCAVPIAGAACPSVAHAQASTGQTIIYGQAIVLPANCHNRFVVATKLGYSVLLWIGGTLPVDRDEIDGDITKVGRAQLVDATRKTPVVAFVEQSHLSQTAYDALRPTICR